MAQTGECDGTRMSLVILWPLVSLWWTQCTEAVLPNNGYCSTYAEMYYANLAGRIKGGVDIVKLGDMSKCDKSSVNMQYRQIDGRCNHRRDLGSAHRPVKRYMRPHYQDKYGLNTPRIYGVDGKLLRSARDISWRISPDVSRPDRHTLLLMQMGQLIDHDITSAIVPTETNSSIKCCGLPYDQIPSECFPISIKPSDPVFKGDCMEFVRSEPVKNEDGETLYPREQVNALTSFLDCSAFYGHDKETMGSLRTLDGKGALLNTERVNDQERLPHNEESECLDDTNMDGSYCQLAGDHRVNEQPCLGAIHTMFHLEHNRVVRMFVAAILEKKGEPSTPEDVKLYLDNASLESHEKLFQEAKKVLGGIFQKIVFCDWVSLVVGPRLVRKFKLGCKRTNKYNPFVDPRIANAFLSAAFRFGHTLIPNKLRINFQQKELKTEFMNPSSNLQHYETIVEALTWDSTQESFDRFMSKSVTEHLFETTEEAPLDLVALNIQRGRDHGIPGYYYWRHYYRLRRLRNFSNFGENARLMRRLYRNIRDVDLFVGGLLEKPMPGAVVGPTFGHIIANQFADIKYGDSYFFLRKMKPDEKEGFTKEQREAILAVDIKSILCNQSWMKKVQENPFLQVSDKNPYILCSDIPSIDLKPWMNQPW